jgi:uroporphyrinogen III methyltransferase/synthase
MSHSPKPGKVYLVGAGPGDPGLITLAAQMAMVDADVVVKDRLAPDVLSPGWPCEVIDAGKGPGDHKMTQDEINALLIKLAKEGKKVVRLKGGDPFVFGRGGEEAIALAEAGIEFEVVPGVTSAIAAPAYAGIPVTHRGIATSFAVITGHEADDKSSSGIKWDKISTGVDTLVFLMGVENLSAIVENLVSNGRSAETPVAVIENGTTPRQRVVTGTLADIVGKCEEAGIKAPAVTVVGEVVRLREKIAWFEKKPLLGRRVTVTRTDSQSDEVLDVLIDLGADVEVRPVLRFVPPPNYAPLDAAIARLADFDWIVFTSERGVHRFLRRLQDNCTDIRAMAGLKIAAIGPVTADALTRERLKVDFVPSKFVAESVVEEFPEDPAGKSVLIPRALEARDAIIKGLEAKGARVEAVPVYQTVRDERFGERLRELASSGEMDIVTFTSPSTIKHFLGLLGDVPVPESALIACIGPITADAVREHGLEPDIVADDFTAEGLVNAILAHLGKAI